jgi:hypothetical protein
MVTGFSNGFQIFFLVQVEMLAAEHDKGASNKEGSGSMDPSGRGPVSGLQKDTAFLDPETRAKVIIHTMKLDFGVALSF